MGSGPLRPLMISERLCREIRDEIEAVLAKQGFDCFECFFELVNKEPQILRSFKDAAAHYPVKTHDILKITIRAGCLVVAPEEVKL